MTFDTRPRYGEGRTTFLAERARERASEEHRFRKQKASAEKAIQDESDSEGFFSFVFGVGASVAGFFIGLGTGQPLKGAAIGWTAGSEAGKWIHNVTTDYESEDYHVSTNVGLYDVTQKHDLEAFNAALDAQQSSEFWQDVTGTGKSLLSLYYLSQGGTGGTGGTEKLSEGEMLFYDDVPAFDPFNNINLPAESRGILS